MALDRKIKRNKAKKYYKENTKGIEKRYRVNFNFFWKKFKEEN